MEEALSEAKSALGAQEIESIKKAEDALTAASHKIAEEMYKKSSAKDGASHDGQDGAGQKKNSAEEQPVDAEYKVEDENK